MGRLTKRVGRRGEAAAITVTARQHPRSPRKFSRNRPEATIQNHQYAFRRVLIAAILADWAAHPRRCNSAGDDACVWRASHLDLKKRRWDRRRYAWLSPIEIYSSRWAREDRGPEITR